MTNYPAALDTFQNPTATTLMDASGLEHDVQHGNLNDAVAALQAYLGAQNSQVSTSITYLLAQAMAKLAGMVSGVAAIGTEVTSGQITGLALAFTPTKVILTVQAPDSNGENLWATLIGGPTTDGFSYSLSGATDRTGYVLHYLILK